MSSSEAKVGNSEGKVLTIVIPFRYSPYLFQSLERIDKICSTVPKKFIDILLVDYGSDPNDIEKYAFLSKYENFSCHRVELSPGTPFSIGEARDLGVRYATTPAVMFHDVDFLCSTSMYMKIYYEMIARGIHDKNTSRFFCVPVAFLKQPASDNLVGIFNDSDANFFDHYFHDILKNYSKKYCEFLVYGSSAILVNRSHYLRVGGHSKAFTGHGAEDYDLIYRLSKFYQKGPKTKDFYLNTSSNEISTYRGFRAYFALYGIDIFMKGIAMMHLWHPTRQMPNYFQSKKNFALLDVLMKDLDRSGVMPDPMADPHLNDRTLILSEASCAFTRSIRDALPLMGEVDFVSENRFSSPAELVKYVSDGGYTCLGFRNPYGNESRESLYQHIKSIGVKFWAFDRGALPDSWFFDGSGINFDSDSYSEEKWDNVELNQEQTLKTLDYLSWLNSGEQTLEKNGFRYGGEHFKLRLGLSGRKILFVPFQRPSDSVCKHFSGSVDGFSGFVKFLSELSDKLVQQDSNWVILAKTHPLEDSIPDLPNVRVVNPDSHVYDLIEMSDAVFLLNSGVGLLAACKGKPVLHVGDAFYSFSGICTRVRSVSEALYELNNLKCVDLDKLYRFIYYLRFEFYSFGAANYRSIVRKEDGGRVSLADGIRFSVVRVMDREVFYGDVDKGVSLDEPLFASFGGRAEIASKNHTSKKKHSSDKHKVNRELSSTEKGRAERETVSRNNVVDTSLSNDGLRIKLFKGVFKSMISSKKFTKLDKNPYLFFIDSKLPLKKTLIKVLGVRKS